jgi:hypothetical protein
MLQLTEKWAPILASQPETGMGYQIATITLHDGRAFGGAVIVGGLITKVGDNPEIPFREDEIAAIVVITS